jgi:hypothetical protein
VLQNVKAEDHDCLTCNRCNVEHPSTRRSRGFEWRSLATCRKKRCRLTRTCKIALCPQLRDERPSWIRPALTLDFSYVKESMYWSTSRSRHLAFTRLANLHNGRTWYASLDLSSFVSGIVTWLTKQLAQLRIPPSPSFFRTSVPGQGSWCRHVVLYLLPSTVSSIRTVLLSWVGVATDKYTCTLSRNSDKTELLFW